MPTLLVGTKHIMVCSLTLWGGRVPVISTIMQPSSTIPSIWDVNVLNGSEILLSLARTFVLPTMASSQVRASKAGTYVLVLKMRSIWRVGNWQSNFLTLFLPLVKNRILLWDGRLVDS